MHDVQRVQIGKGRAQLKHNKPHLRLIETAIVLILVIAIELIEVHGVVLKDEVYWGLRDDAIEKGGDIGVFDFFENLELSRWHVVEGCVLERDYLDCECLLRFFVDCLVDSAVWAFSDLLDQLKGRHLPNFYNDLWIKSASVNLAPPFFRRFTEYNSFICVFEIDYMNFITLLEIKQCLVYLKFSKMIV